MSKALTAKIWKTGRVDDVFSETNSDCAGPDGKDWWVYLKSGWRVYDNECHTIHEATLKACLEQVNMAVPCDCEECAAAVGETQGS